MGRPAMRVKFGLFGRKTFYLIESSDRKVRIKHSDGSIVVSPCSDIAPEDGDIIATPGGRLSTVLAHSLERVEIPEARCEGL